MRLRLAGLAVSAVAAWLVLRSVDIGAVVALLARANPVPLVVALGLIAIQVALRSYRWRTLLPPASAPISLSSVAGAMLVGYLANAVLPARLGEPLRAYVLARRHGLDAPQTFGSVILERTVDIAVLAIVAWLAAIATRAPAWLVYGTAATAAVGGLVLLLLSTGGLELLLKRARSTALARVRFFGVVERLATGASARERRPLVLLAAAISTVAWMLDAGTYWLVGQALGIGVPPTGALLISAVTVLGTALPSAPGYLGTFELAASAMAGFLGVGPAPALAFAALAHAVTVVPLAIAGAIALIVASGGVRSLSGLGTAAKSLAASPSEREVEA